MVIFDEAVYYEQDKPVQVSSDDLRNLSTLMKVKSMELWESDAKNIRIFPCYLDHNWRFASLSNTVRSIERYKQNSKDVKRYADQLKQQLNSANYSFISFMKNKDFPPTTVHLLNSEDYRWDVSVARDLNKEERILHNVFGQYTKSLNTDERHPYVGIEIIDQDYPTGNMLNAMFEATSSMPYFIFLAFMDGGSLFQLDKLTRTVVSSYFIYDGSLWRNCKKLNVSDKELKKLIISDIKKYGLKHKNDEEEICL